MPAPGRPRFAISVRRRTRDDLIRCRHCGYEGRVLERHLPYRWYFLPLGFVIGCTGIGLILLVLVVINLGRWSWPCCPQCGAASRLAGWRGPPTPGAEDVWRAAAERDRREFHRTRLALTGLLGLLLGIACLYLLMQMWFG